MTIISPIPDSAPKLPDSLSYKDANNAWQKSKISSLWPYKNASGQVLFYVCRIDTPEGKQTPPLTLHDEDGKLSWKRKGPEGVRPLYNLDHIVNCQDATIVMVEGEKCAQSLQSFINSCGAQNKLVACTWMGGVNGISKTDITPLFNRKVILWPDNDEPGFIAMGQLALALKDKTIKLFAVNIPSDHPKAWDVADYLECGPSYNDLIQFINSNKIEPDKYAQAYIDSKQKNTPSVSTVKPDLEPFKCLGYYHNDYFYMPKDKKQVLKLNFKEHSQTSLISLAHISYWQLNYPSTQGVDWKRAISEIQGKCVQAGIYDASKLRGRGAWIDNDRIVLHLGSRLLVDGKECNVDNIESKYIYELERDINETTDKPPLSDKEAYEIFRICKSLNWERELHAYYFAGWLTVAPICGALYWRPHIWITGGASAGKTYVLDNIMRPCVGPFAVSVQSNSTEAGIRQKLKHDSLPVDFDEIESENEDGQRRVQNVLDLSRQASSESGGRILKGGQSGTSQEYQIRSMFCFSSIGVQLEQQSDISRVNVLTLTDPMVSRGWDQAQKTAHFKILKSLIQCHITKENCIRLRARTLKLIPVIRQNSITFANVATEKLNSKRAGDQAGALLAGAYSLTSSEIITEEKAMEFVNNMEWSEEYETNSYTDYGKCLNIILDHILKFQVDEKSKSEFSVKEIVYKIHTRQENSAWEEHHAALKRNGIKVCDGYLHISQSHNMIKKMLTGTSWGKTYSRVLSRLPGAEKTNCQYFSDELRARSIKIPLGLIYNY